MYFALARGGGCPWSCPACEVKSCAFTPTPTPELDPDGRQIFRSGSDAYFMIVVEARPSGAAVNQTVLPLDSSQRPGLQLFTSNALGPDTPPAAEVDCRSGLSLDQYGGIPGVDPPDYDDPSDTVTDALTDLACRFQATTDRESACTVDVAGRPAFLNPAGATNGIVQFCHFVIAKSSFPAGQDTVLTVRVADTAGKLGPASEIVVHIGP